MPAVYPFRAVHFADAATERLNSLIAPPYDVLDEAAKEHLLSQDSENVVGIDLPHLPAKELGPSEVYQQAAETYHRWLAEGTLRRCARPTMFVYRQTYDFDGTTYSRSGMACTLDVLPFGPRKGGGILPHEQTFSGPKADRLALMQATKAQLSPIFALHEDAEGTATALLQKVSASRRADHRAAMGDGVVHEVWLVDDAPTLKAYRQALAGEDAFIADGHHRYNTALNYLAGLEAAGEVPTEHPARHCMMVLVSMSDPGLVIGPTHRVLGGMADYSLEAFLIAAEEHLTMAEHTGGVETLEAAMAARSGDHRNVLGLYDFESGRTFVAIPTADDPLARTCGDHHPDWRGLDVALVQHLVVEGLCQPRLNGGKPVLWAFPHSIEEVLALGSSQEKDSGGGGTFTSQLAVILRPTPLKAVRAVSRAGELMPQKSTFFTPKMATGLFLNPLD
jgi:uncharacterized protein (DUF1015 family)